MKKQKQIHSEYLETVRALKATHAWLERLVEKHGEFFAGPMGALESARNALAKFESQQQVKQCN